MVHVPGSGLQQMKEQMEAMVQTPSFSSGLNDHHVFVLKATFANTSQLDSFIMVHLAGNPYNVQFAVAGLVVYMWE